MARMGIIAGAMRGLGEGLEGSAVDLFRAELIRSRDDRMMAHQSGEAQKTRDFTAEQNQAGRDLTVSENQKSRDLTVSEGQKTRELTTSEGQKTREHQTGQTDRTLASHERVATDQRASAERIAQWHIEAQQKIAGMQASLQKLLHGPTAELAREQIKALQTINTLRTDYANSIRDGDDNAAKNLRKRIEALGYTGDKGDVQGLIAIAGAAGKLASSIDATPEDKKVYGDIFKMALTSAMGEKDINPTATRGEPPAAAIEFLKKNATDSKVISDFRTKYNVDPSRYLQGTTTNPTRSGAQADAPRPGLAQVLDEQRPPQRRPPRSLIDDDYMPAP